MRSKQSIVRNIESNHRIANAENNNNNDSVSENEANMNRQIKFSKRLCLIQITLIVKI